MVKPEGNHHPLRRRRPLHAKHHGARRYHGNGGRQLLGGVLSEVIRGTISLPNAITIYESHHIPRAWTKRQISYTSGLINLDTSTEQIPAGNLASRPEVDPKLRNPVSPGPLPSTFRSWQFYCNFASVPDVFTYDAEAEADNAVCEFLQSKGGFDESGMVSKALKAKWGGYVCDNGIGGGEGEGRNGIGHEDLGMEDYRRFGKGL